MTEPTYVQAGDFWIGIDPGVSDSFVAVALQAVQDLPVQIRSALAAAGAYAWLTPTIIGKYPYYADYEVSGYAAGAGWEEVSGVYNRRYRAAVMAETYRVRGEWVSDVPNYPWPLLHELGHAVDYTLGRPARSPGFRSVYLADRSNALKKWPLECCDPEEIGYFTGPWARGAVEAFAEACSRLWLPQAQRNTLFCIAFANTMAWVETYLSEIPEQRERTAA